MFFARVSMQRVIKLLAPSEYVPSRMLLCSCRRRPTAPPVARFGFFFCAALSLSSSLLHGLQSNPPFGPFRL